MHGPISAQCSLSILEIVFTEDRTERCKGKLPALEPVSAAGTLVRKERLPEATR